MRFRYVTLLAVCSRWPAILPGGGTPLLVQTPTLSKTEIVFAYGGYLWSVGREGGNTRQQLPADMNRGRSFLPTESGSRSRESTTETWMRS